MVDAHHTFTLSSQSISADADCVGVTANQLNVTHMLPSTLHARTDRDDHDRYAMIIEFYM
jgi:hypothetical protein